MSQEPSRFTVDAAHFPAYASHKLRYQAQAGLGELNAQVAEVNRLFRLDDDFGTPPPHVITVVDVTRNIVVDPADQQAIQKLVTEANPSFSAKTQTVRLTHALGGFLTTLRAQFKHIDSDTRGEIVRRALQFWRRNAQTDYGKNPTVRFQRGTGMDKAYVISTAKLLAKSMSHKYLSKKPDGRGGWIYKYTEAHDGTPGPDEVHPHEALSDVMYPLHSWEHKSTARTPDVLNTKETLQAVVERAKMLSTKDKKFVLQELRNHQEKLRVHHTNMAKYGRKEQLRARAVRNMVTDAIAAIVGKSAEAKKKASEKNAKKYAEEKADSLKRDYDRFGAGTAGVFRRAYREHLEDFERRYGHLSKGHEDSKPEETERERQARLEGQGQQRLALSVTAWDAYVRERRRGMR